MNGRYSLPTSTVERWISGCHHQHVSFEGFFKNHPFPIGSMYYLPTWMVDSVDFYGVLPWRFCFGKRLHLLCKPKRRPKDDQDSSQEDGPRPKKTHGFPRPEDLGVNPKIWENPPNHPILIGFPIINHPFWGYPYIWKHPFFATSKSLKLREVFDFFGDKSAKDGMLSNMSTWSERKCVRDFFWMDATNFTLW